MVAQKTETKKVFNTFCNLLSIITQIWLNKIKPMHEIFPKFQSYTNKTACLTAAQTNGQNKPPLPPSPPFKGKSLVVKMGICTCINVMNRQA